MTKEKMLECRDSAMWTEVGGDIEKVNGRTSFDCMRKGDAAAKEVVDMYLEYLATGTANIINIFQPSVLAFGGGISNERENLLTPLRALIDRETYGSNNENKTQLKIAELRNDAGIIGAAALTK